MQEVKSVQIGYSRAVGSEPHPASVVTRSHPSVKDLELVFLEGVQGETLRIKLSTGKVVDISLYERTPGFLSIQMDGQMVIKPQASNSIEVGMP